MNKRFCIWTAIIALIIISLIVIYRITNTINKPNISEENINSTNSINISTEQGEVTDECLDEWDDYNKYVGEKIEEASNNLQEDDTHYLLKDVWGYIEVYYLDNDKQEYLYKKTSIATDYLSQEDIDDLKIGIEVVGVQALNKMLEDFE